MLNIYLPLCSYSRMDSEQEGEQTVAHNPQCSQQGGAGVLGFQRAV